MKFFLWLLPLLWTGLWPVYAQQTPEALQMKYIQELRETDRDFSLLSAQRGIAVAFSTYMDEKGTLLRPGQSPVQGKQSISSELGGAGNEQGVLTWEPHAAEVSASGDLGYTYGTYRMTAKKPDGSLQVAFGTYVSVWKRQPDGSWRVVLDTGNPGLETPSKTRMESFELLKELQGQWTAPQEGKIYKQDWKKTDDFTYEGSAWQMVKNDTLLPQQLRIEMRGNTIYYLLQAVGSDKPVFFKLTTWRDNEWVFENTNPGFPGRIRLRMKNQGDLKIVLEGQQEGSFLQQSLTFTRK